MGRCGEGVSSSSPSLPPHNGLCRKPCVCRAAGEENGLEHLLALWSPVLMSLSSFLLPGRGHDSHGCKDLSQSRVEWHLSLLITSPVLLHSLLWP